MALSVLRFMASNYPIDIFKLFTLTLGRVQILNQIFFRYKWLFSVIYVNNLIKSFNLIPTIRIIKYGNWRNDLYWYFNFEI
jgi:hypothetical protein